VKGTVAQSKFDLLELKNDVEDVTLLNRNVASESELVMAERPIWGCFCAAYL